MYLIAIVVALLGLWVSSEVRANELCGLRSSGVFSVERWTIRQTEGGIDYRITLRSRDAKAIRNVGGSVEFFLGGRSAARMQIVLKQDVAPGDTVNLQVSKAQGDDTVKLTQAPAGEVKVRACIAGIEYQDGSGLIIN